MTQSAIYLSLLTGFIRCGMNNYEIIGAMNENGLYVSYNRVEAQKIALKIIDTIKSGRKVNLEKL